MFKLEDTLERHSPFFPIAHGTKLNLGRSYWPQGTQGAVTITQLHISQPSLFSLLHVVLFHIYNLQNTLEIKMLPFRCYPLVHVKMLRVLMLPKHWPSEVPQISGQGIWPSWPTALRPIPSELLPPFQPSPSSRGWAYPARPEFFPSRSPPMACCYDLPPVPSFWNILLLVTNSAYWSPLNVCKWTLLTLYPK